MTALVKGTLYPNKFIVKWKIKQFFGDSQEAGHYYQSPVFPIQYPNRNTKWCLKVYPKGLTKQEKDYVSAYLHLICSSDDEVTVDFELSIENEESCSVKTKYTNTFECSHSDWGWKQFRKIDVIKDLKDKALIDDTLTILCEITFFPSIADVTERFHGYDIWLDKIGNQFADCERLFENGKFTDVTFNVQDKQIHSHKAILSHRSPVFNAMFEHEMKETNKNVVDITDVDYDVMRELFRFIYSGSVKNIDNIASDLFIAADKYQVTELKALCEQKLYHDLTVDNAIDYLKLTEICNTIHLRELVTKFVTAHYKEMVRKPEFGDLDSQVMHRILLAVAEKD